MFIFVGRPENLDNPEEGDFMHNRGFPDSANGNGHWISILQVKKNYPVKFPLPRKFNVDTLEFQAITVTKKRLEIFRRNYFFFLFNEVHLYLQNPNLMSIFVSRNRKTSIIRKKTCIFRIVEGIKVKLTNKKKTSAVQYPINCNVLLPPVAKRVELINISGPKRGFGWRGAERIPTQPSLRKPLPPYLIFSINRKKRLFQNIKIFRSRPTKMDIGFEFFTSKYTTLILKKKGKTLFWTFLNFSVTVIARHSELSVKFYIMHITKN